MNMRATIMSACLAALLAGCSGSSIAASPERGVFRGGLLVSPYGYEVAPPQPLPDEPLTGYARYEGYFPNTELTTHEGKTVRFYDDLLRDRVVLVNFMYTQCDGI